MAKIHIFSMVFRHPFREWFCKFALPSLIQPGNIPALRAAGHEFTHTVYCEDTDMAALAEAAGYWGAKITFRPFKLTQPISSLREVQAKLLIDAASRAIDEDAYFVPAAAVAVWSNGALSNIVRVAEETDCAVGAIYLLADGDKFAAYNARRFEVEQLEQPIEGDELVTRCLENLHPGSRSTLNRETSRAFLYGLGMMQLSPTLIAARIQVPSVACIKLKSQDLALFKLEDDFRVWDAGPWCGKLIAENRFTFLASSDLALQVNMVRPGKMRMDRYAELDAALGPLVDRRSVLRTTIQSERARTFMSTLRANREVTL